MLFAVCDVRCLLSVMCWWVCSVRCVLLADCSLVSLLVGYGQLFFKKIVGCCVLFDVCFLSECWSFGCWLVVCCFGSLLSVACCLLRVVRCLVFVGPGWLVMVRRSLCVVC